MIQSLKLSRPLHGGHPDLSVNLEGIAIDVRWTSPSCARFSSFFTLLQIRFVSVLSDGSVGSRAGRALPPPMVCMSVSMPSTVGATVSVSDHRHGPAAELLESVEELLDLDDARHVRCGRLRRTDDQLSTNLQGLCRIA